MKMAVTQTVSASYNTAGLTAVLYNIYLNIYIFYYKWSLHTYMIIIFVTFLA